MNDVIKVYMKYEDTTKTHYYRKFVIIDELPKKKGKWLGEEIVSIEQVDVDCELVADLDCERKGKKVVDYNYYQMTTTNVFIRYDEKLEEKREEIKTIRYVCTYKKTSEKKEENEKKSKKKVSRPAKLMLSKRIVHTGPSNLIKDYIKKVSTKETK